MPQAKSTAIFIFHLIITIGAYFVPFLISWQIAVPVFVATILQHAIFGRCLLNAKHDRRSGIDDGAIPVPHNQLIALLLVFAMTYFRR